MSEIREKVPIFPLYTVLFPGATLPLHIFESRYLEMMQRVLETREEIGIALIAEGKEVGGPARPYDVGTLARVVRMERLEDGTLNVRVLGTRRFRVRRLYDPAPYLQGDVEVVQEPTSDSVRAYALSVKVQDLWQQYTAMMRRIVGVEVGRGERPQTALEWAFYVGAGLMCGLKDKQRLLSTWDVADMLAQEIVLLYRELALLRFMAETQQREEERRLGPTGYISRN